MKNKKSWLAGFAITAVCLALLWRICPICFQNNDDKVLMYLTAGYTTGAPEMGTIFGSFYYYGVIGLFYRIYDGMAWYTIFELLVVAVSLWIICTSLINSTERNGKLGAILFVVLFLFSFMHFSTALQYTATAGLAAGAGVASLAASQMAGKKHGTRNSLEEEVEAAYADVKEEKDRKLNNNCNFVVAVIMLVVAYGIRKQFGLVGLAAALIVLFFEYFGENKKQVIKNTIILLVAMAVAYGGNAIYEHASGIADFQEYYDQAGTWIDYPHLQYKYDTNGVYKSAGWDEFLYNVASSWFFMDENCNTNSFKTIVDSYDINNLSIEGHFKAAYGLLSINGIINTQVIVWMVMLILANIVWLKNNHKRKVISKDNKIEDETRLNRGISGLDILTIDGLFGMFALISLYFLYQARFPMRAYQALVFIFFVPSVVIMARYLFENKAPIVIAIVTICGVGFILPDSIMVKKTYNFTNDPNVRAVVAQVTGLEAYAVEHPNNMYIYDADLSEPAAPFGVFKGGVPKNAVSWGGWTYNSPMYWKQVKANGFETLYSDDFFSGRVYFCGREISNPLCDYIKARYPDATVEMVDEVGGIKVYQFQNGTD